MGGTNKLLAPAGGVSVLEHVVGAALASRACPVIVVTGHEGARVARRLAAYPVAVVHNPDYAGGLSTSLVRGIEAVPARCEGALVLLGDMPRVTAEHLNRLLAAFAPEQGRAICVPTHEGRRGNPVLWARRFFDEMRRLEGDVGAKEVLSRHPEAVYEVEVSDPGVLFDVDTPQALRAVEGTGEDAR